MKPTQRSYEHQRFVVISGCSGGGKSTLLEELRLRGYSVVPEPGRRLVQSELASCGRVLPWIDLQAFARRAIELAQADLDHAAMQHGWVFFDRGLVDAAAALQYATGEPVTAEVAARYYPDVFLTPPWPEIFIADAERRHDFAAAESEFDRLCHLYPLLGYNVILIPKVSVKDRADFVLGHLRPALI